MLNKMTLSYQNQSIYMKNSTAQIYIELKPIMNGMRKTSSSLHEPFNGCVSMLYVLNSWLPSRLLPLVCDLLVADFTLPFFEMKSTKRQTSTRCSPLLTLRTPVRYGPLTHLQKPANIDY